LIAPKGAERAEVEEEGFGICNLKPFFLIGICFLCAFVVKYIRQIRHGKAGRAAQVR
jgi:hypothetical protein